MYKDQNTEVAFVRYMFWPLTPTNPIIQMIATILPGSSNFHAVDYNERKVAKGVARLLEIQNFGALGEVRKPTPDELTQFLME